MGTLRVILYQGFVEFFKNYYEAENYEEKAHLWEVLETIVQDNEQREAAFSMYFQLIQMAEFLRTEYVLKDEKEQKFLFLNERGKFRRFDSYDYPVLVEAIEDLQTLLGIDLN